MSLNNLLICSHLDIASTKVYFSTHWCMLLHHKGCKLVILRFFTNIVWEWPICDFGCFFSPKIPILWRSFIRISFQKSQRLTKLNKSSPALKGKSTCNISCLLEGMARYAGLLQAPVAGFGQKKRLLCCFGPFLAIFGVQ